jgi:hypothetical protein
MFSFDVYFQEYNGFNDIIEIFTKSKLIQYKIMN